MTTATDLRDRYLVAFSVGYDWENSAHFAELILRGEDGADFKCRVVGLTSWGAFEDFTAKHVERCTLLREASGVYLSLDPHIEGRRSAKDNFWFIGSAV